MEKLGFWVESGNGTVTVAGQNSANNTRVQRSFPGATVTVYNAGSNNLATIYSDNNNTALANPFTANNNGYAAFYAPNGRYDVQFSGNNAGIATPFTLSDFSLGAIQTLNNLNGQSQNFAVTANNNNFTIVSANNNHTFNLPSANANARGALLAADWSNFNAKLGNLAATAPLTYANGVVALTTPLAIAYGGSNSNNKTAAFNALSPQNTKGDLVVYDNNNVVVRLPVGANNLTLVANAASNNGMAWSQLSLTAGVSGILPVANGGTNSNNNTQAFGTLAPTTTKGDLIARNNNGINVRVGIGANNFTLQANAANDTGVVWAAVNLAGSGVTGILPLANGGTNSNNAAQAFQTLTPLTTKGDLLAANNNNVSVRFPAGNNNQYLAANSANATGLVWVTPFEAIQKYTIHANNAAFTANSLTVDLTLFTLGQYQKITGVTSKHSAQFLNANNTITDVTLCIGHAGNSFFYTANTSIGNNTAVANNAFLDTNLFKSANMGAGNAVLARFTAANANFGDGANTTMTGGTVDIWLRVTSLQ